ncbi:MAG: glycosyltransferase family 9 protein [bacterium]|nr:glycosyltransferase family 9 protein [bacterium]
MTKIEIVRNIDKYLGTIICWLLSRCYAIERAIKRKKAFLPPQKILLLKPAEMGTSVLAYPAIKELKEMFKGVELYFLTFNENVEIIQLLEIIPKENILPIRIDSALNFIKDTLLAILKMRRLGIDATIDLEFFSRYTAILSYLIGAKQRVGLDRFNAEGLYRGNLLTHKVNYNHYLHVGQTFLALIYGLKYPAGKITMAEKLLIDKESLPKLTSTKEERMNIWNKLKNLNPELAKKMPEEVKIVLFPPKTGEWLSFKEWPIEYFAKLGKQLLSEDEKVYIVIVGTASASPSAKELISLIGKEKCLDLTGKTTLKELIDLYNISSVLVTVDSGTAHFAALTNIKTISIFGPETPQVFGPLSEHCICLVPEISCHPCFSIFNGRTINCEDEQEIKSCVMDTTPEKVYKVVKGLLYAEKLTDFQKI